MKKGEFKRNYEVCIIEEGETVGKVVKRREAVMEFE